MTFTSVLTKSAGALINIGVMNHLKKHYNLTNHRYSLSIASIIETIVRTPKNHYMLDELQLSLIDIGEKPYLYIINSMLREKVRQVI